MPGNPSFAERSKISTLSQCAARYPSLRFWEVKAVAVMSQVAAGRIGTAVVLDEPAQEALDRAIGVYLERKRAFGRPVARSA